MSPASGGLCLVLGAGGFRGLAHAGVLKGLRRAGIPIRSLIGVSIGGLVASFHAGLGYEPERIVERLSRLTTPALFALGLALRRWGPISRRARRPAGPFLEELERLRECRMDRLHFGVERLGLLALDLPSGREIFAATGLPSAFTLRDLALGGASIPGLFPAVRVSAPGGTRRLVDGGFSHSVPVERAFAPPFSAQRVLAVDLQVIRGFREWEAGRWERLQREHGDALIRLRPSVENTGAIFFRPEQGADLVRAGEAAITDDLLARLTPSPARC